MHKHEVAKPEMQGTLKQNFETALGELREEQTPEKIARKRPIVSRTRRFADGKAQAVALAAGALATLWGV